MKPTQITALSLAAAGLLAGAPLAPVQADTFDGDSATDIFLIDSNGSIRWREAAAGGTFPERQNFGATPHIALGLGHFKTGMDLIYAVESGGLNRATYEPGTGLAAYRETISGGQTRFSSVGVGKWSQDDGFGNVFVVNSGLTPGAPGALQFFNASGSDNGAHTFATFSNGPFQSTGVGNYDGDANGDLFASRLPAPNTGNLDWIEAPGTFRARPFGPVPPSSIQASADTIVHAMTLGDVDGDGLNELYTVMPDGSITGFESPGDNGTSTVLFEDFESGVSALAVGDLNGDGNFELLVGHTSTALTAYDYGAGGTLLPAVVPADLLAATANGVRDLAAVSVVPEPTSMAGLVLTVGLLAGRRRRRAR